MDAAYAIYAVLAAILVGSSLAARRIPAGSMVRMALIWVAIFAAVYGLFLLVQALGFRFG